MRRETEFPRAALITQRQAVAILGVSPDSFGRIVRAGGLEPVSRVSAGRDSAVPTSRLSFGARRCPMNENRPPEKDGPPNNYPPQIVSEEEDAASTR
jgi:hypothetical protein